MKYKTPIIAFILLSFSFSGGYSLAEEALTWEACLGEAKKNHPDLASAYEQIKQYKAAKEVTRSTALPQITGSASENTSKGAAFGSSGGTDQSGVAISSGGKGSSTTYQYAGSFQQLLFDGFKTSHNLSSAERNISSSRYNYDVTSSNIRLRLRTAYANLLSTAELVKVTENIEARRKQNLELVRLRYEGGREHKGSLMKSEADLAQAVYEVNQAKRAVYLTERQLTKELGRKNFSPVAITGTLEVKDDQRERPDFEGLAESTPLLQQLIVKKEAAKYGLLSAKAQFFPTVYASGNMGNVNKDAFPDKNQWAIGTTLSWPIFDGGSTIATVAQNRALVGQAEENERSGRDGVIYTLSNTWTQLQNAVDNVGVQRKILEATEERARISEAEYSIGLLSYDNWIIIEDNLVSAKKSFVNAQNTAMIAEANWVQAKGGTLDYD